MMESHDPTRSIDTKTMKALFELFTRVQKIESVLTEVQERLWAERILRDVHYFGVESESEE